MIPIDVSAIVFGVWALLVLGLVYGVGRFQGWHRGAEWRESWEKVRTLAESEESAWRAAGDSGLAWVARALEQAEPRLATEGTEDTENREPIGTATTRTTNKHELTRMEGKAMTDHEIRVAVMVGAVRVDRGDLQFTGWLLKPGLSSGWAVKDKVRFADIMNSIGARDNYGSVLLDGASGGLMVSDVAFGRWDALTAKAAAGVAVDRVFGKK